MLKKINRLMAAYYDAKRQGEKRRAAVIYKKLYKLGVIL